MGNKFDRIAVCIQGGEISDKKPRQLPLEHGRDGSSDHRKNFGHFYERELDKIPHPQENLDVNWSPKQFLVYLHGCFYKKLIFCLRL